MRVMVIVKATSESEAGVLPSAELLTEMGKFNEELVKAGVMLAGEGLQSSSKGVRVRFGGGKGAVIDGPFTETKELIAGYWLWQVKSMEEAVEWIRRSPFRKGNETVARRRRHQELAAAAGATLPTHIYIRSHHASRSPPAFQGQLPRGLRFLCPDLRRQDRVRHDVRGVAGGGRNGPASAQPDHSRAPGPRRPAALRLRYAPG